MRLIRTTFSIVTIAGLAVALFLWIALPLLQEPPAVFIPPESAVATEAAASMPVADTTPVPPPAGSIDELPRPIATTGTRLLEIFGRISDSEGRPIEDVLVTEERVFTSTRSDALGNYRLLLELPRQRLPILNYLRAGYRGERVHLTWAQLGDRPVHALDVNLADTTDTLRLDGWVVNDLGVPLEGARITIKALKTSADKLFYLTVFSDERGQFSLEGVRASTRYQLTATLAPQYPIHSDPEFFVGTEVAPFEIVLKSLQFVNLGGMILARDGQPVPDVEFYIKNLSTGLHRRKFVSDSSGFFTLEEFPLGDVVLTTRGAEFFRIKGLEINATNHANLALVVDRGDRYLGGWVSDANGQPLDKVMVTLDASHEADGIEYYSYRSQTTDNSGHFAFTDLAQGSYRVSAYATGFGILKMSYTIESQPQPLRLVLKRAD